MATPPPAPISASLFFLYNPTISILSGRRRGGGAMRRRGRKGGGGTACPPPFHQLYLSTVCHWYLCCTAYHHYFCCLLLLVLLCRLERGTGLPCPSPLMYKICINHTASQPQALFSHDLSITVGNLFYCNKVSFFSSAFLLLNFYPFLF